MTEAVEDSQYSVYRTLLTYRGQDIWEIDEAGIRVGFLLPFDGIEPSGSKGKNPNIAFSVERLAIAKQKERDFLKITAKQGVDKEIFRAFVWSLLANLPFQGGLQPILDFVSSEYAKWETFFGSKGTPKEEVSRFVGLYGELSVLRNIVEKFGPDAVSTWWGPFSNRHDFEFPTFAIEVKTTMNISEISIQIHGLRQFQDDYNRRVYLLCERVVPSISGESIQDLYESLLKLGVVKSEIDNRIRKLGKIEDIFNHSKELKMLHLSTTKYEITEDFPILRSYMIPDEVKSRVTGLGYSLDLTGLDFEIYDPIRSWDSM